MRFAATIGQREGLAGLAGAVAVVDLAKGTLQGQAAASRCVSRWLCSWQQTEAGAHLRLLLYLGVQSSQHDGSNDSMGICV
jgi:hypothetical protein